MTAAQHTHPEIVAIGASAGGLEPICALMRRLPADLPACVLVVLHRAPSVHSHLAGIIARNAHMSVLLAEEGAVLERGTCLIGSPDRHLTVTPDLRVHLAHDSFYRAHNIDALFNSLARCAGARTIGVILSGALKDGALGLRAIRESGGVALVQSPSNATFPEMPQSAIAFDGPIDFIGSADALAEEICRRVGCTPLRGPKA
jgi:two-component system chemotaxis response regulator CheB